METIIAKIRQKLNKYEIGFIKFVDVSDLPKEYTHNCNCAILFGLPLPSDFIYNIDMGKPIRFNMFDVLEERVKRLADFIADYLVEEGYRAFSQSDEEQEMNETYNEDSFRSQLPHKTLALRAGLGWIGKNDLCNSYDYGCGFSMCSILTDAPFDSVKYSPAEPKCGKCTVCRDICPTGAISGTMWYPGIDRDELVNTNACVLCLKCLACCPFTKSKRKYRL